jgi:hypothetical protein
MSTTDQSTNVAAVNAQTAKVRVIIMGDNGVDVEINNTKGQPSTAQDVLVAAAVLLGLPAYRPTANGVHRNGQPAHLDDIVQPGDLVGSSANVSNG